MFALRTMPVYVFGSGDCGQLGMGEDVVHAARPTVHPFFEDLLRTTGAEIVAVAAGGLHSLALSSCGDVQCCLLCLLVARFTHGAVTTKRH